MIYKSLNFYVTKANKTKIKTYGGIVLRTVVEWSAGGRGAWRQGRVQGKRVEGRRGWGWSE